MSELWVIKMIQRHEGYKGTIYRDINGNPTGGWGHCFAAGSPLPREIWEQIFQYDLRKAEKCVEELQIPPDCVNNVRRGVLVDMAFNLGDKLKDFRGMLAAIRKRDFGLAAWHMEKSLWAQQVGARAKELAKLMAEGVLPKGAI